MFTQEINDQLVANGFRARDKQPLIEAGRLVIMERPHIMGRQISVILDGKEVLNRTVIDVQSVSYSVTSD